MKQLLRSTFTQDREKGPKRISASTKKEKDDVTEDSASIQNHANKSFQKEERITEHGI